MYNYFTLFVISIVIFYFFGILVGYLENYYVFCVNIDIKLHFTLLYM